MNLRSNIEALLSRREVGERSLGWLESAWAVLASTEGIALLCAAGLFGLEFVADLDQEIRNPLRVILGMGIGLITLVLFSWMVRSKKWITFGQLQTCRVRRIVPARSDYWIWIEDSSGTQLSPGFQAGKWASRFKVGDPVVALIAPEGQTLYFIPEHQQNALVASQIS